jgi:hypothetical protein
MSLGLPDPDPLARDRILSFSHKGVERTEIMLAKFIVKAVDLKTDENVPAGKL